MVYVRWVAMRYSPVMEVCKTQSEPEKGEMLEKNHDDRGDLR